MIWGLIINILAFYVTIKIVPGIRVDDLGTLVVVAIVWGILSALLKPILLLLSLPVNVLTLGLFTFVINGILLLITSSLVAGFQVQNLGVAIIASIVLSIVNMFLRGLVR